MRVIVDLPLPPEYLIQNIVGLSIKSRCPLSMRTMHTLVYLILHLRNPYFSLGKRMQQLRDVTVRDVCREDLTVYTLLNQSQGLYESTYSISGRTRIIVTEIRRSNYHGRYFHIQRVIAVLLRDICWHGGVRLP